MGKLPPADGGPVLTIPFQFFHEFIFITVNINNGSSRTFLLDSGTSDNEISLRTAREIGLPMSRFREYSGVAVGEGKTEQSSAKGVSLTIGNAHLYSGKVTICDEGLFEKRLNHPVDGVLGAPLFEAYVVQIDYAKHMVRLFDPRRYELVAKRDVIPIRIRGHEPYIKAAIVKMDGSSVDATLCVDTGADAPLSLNHPFDLKNGLPDPQATKTTTIGTGIGGDSPYIFGHVNKLKIGKTSFSDSPAFFSMARKGLQASDKYDGSVGNYLLVNFLVTFDYPHKQIILQDPISK